MRAIEDICARAVELGLQAEGHVIGPRTRRDAQDGSGLRVDFTFEDANPAVALEVTSIQDSRFLQTGAAAKKLADRLEALVNAGEIDDYEIAIHEHANVKAAEPVVLEAIRAGIVDLDCSSDDLFAWEAAGTLDAQLSLRGRLDAAGIAQLTRTSRATTVTTWGSTTWGPLQGLEPVCADNIAKLIETGAGYEHHLAIGLGSYGITNDPTITPVPELPAGLDRLWVVHLWETPTSDLSVWSTSPGAGAWTVHPNVPRSP